MALIFTKNISALSVFAASLFTSGAFAASPSTTEVIITAKVVESTCVAGWDTSGVSVNLGSVSAAAMPTKGVIGASQPFVLSLTGCSGVTKVHLSATGESASDDNTAFANSSGTAKGVGVLLFGGNNQTTQLLPSNSTTTADYDIKDGNATLALLAKLVRTTDSTNPESFAAGTVLSRATLNLTYE